MGVHECRDLVADPCGGCGEDEALFPSTCIVAVVPTWACVLAMVSRVAAAWEYLDCVLTRPISLVHSYGLNLRVQLGTQPHHNTLT
jgi:hypothetical protein